MRVIEDREDDKHQSLLVAEARLSADKSSAWSLDVDGGVTGNDRLDCRTKRRQRAAREGVRALTVTKAIQPGVLSKHNTIHLQPFPHEVDAVVHVLNPKKSPKCFVSIEREVATR
jgi:hypothetical protein